MTIGITTTRLELHDIIDHIFLEKYKISKKEPRPKGCATLPYTIVTLSAGETKGVKFREPEYLVFNHPKYRISNGRGNASEWMCEEN